MNNSEHFWHTNQHYQNYVKWYLYFKNMDNKKRGKESELRGAVLPVSLSSIVCHQLFLTTFPKILHYVVNDENSVLIILIIHQYLSYILK